MVNLAYVDEDFRNSKSKKKLVKKSNVCSFIIKEFFVTRLPMLIWYFYARGKSFIENMVNIVKSREIWLDAAPSSQWIDEPRLTTTKTGFHTRLMKAASRRTRPVYQGRNSLGKVAGSIVTRAISLSQRLRACLSSRKIEFSPFSLLPR